MEPLSQVTSRPSNAPGLPFSCQHARAGINNEGHELSDVVLLSRLQPRSKALHVACVISSTFFSLLSTCTGGPREPNAPPCSTKLLNHSSLVCVWPWPTFPPTLFLQVRCAPAACGKDPCKAVLRARLRKKRLPMPNTHQLSRNCSVNATLQCWVCCQDLGSMLVKAPWFNLSRTLPDVHYWRGPTQVLHVRNSGCKRFFDHMPRVLNIKPGPSLLPSSV